MRTSEVLHRAADAIEEHGWTRGSNGWGLVGDGLCLEGGLLAAMGWRIEDAYHGLALRSADGRNVKYQDLEACPAYTAVQDYLRDRSTDEYIGYDTARPGRELWRWNDQSGRNAGEVVEVLRAAAEVQAAKEAHLDAVMATYEPNLRAAV